MFYDRYAFVNVTLQLADWLQTRCSDTTIDTLPHNFIRRRHQSKESDNFLLYPGSTGTTGHRFSFGSPKPSVSFSSFLLLPLSLLPEVATPPTVKKTVHGDHCIICFCFLSFRMFSTRLLLSTSNLRCAVTSLTVRSSLMVGGASSTRTLSTVQDFSFPHETTARTVFYERNLPKDNELSPARLKMRSILNEYRQKNFGQTLFSRFVKEILVAADTNCDGKISRNELCRFFHNIGADDCLTTDDITNLMLELGQEEGNERFIYVDDVENLIMQGSEHIVHVPHQAA